MLELSYSVRFKKDLRREQRDPKNKGLAAVLTDFLSLVVSGVEIPSKYHEHQLSGKYIGHFEAHLKPDLLVIYKFNSDSGVILIRLGSHSDLF